MATKKKTKKSKKTQAEREMLTAVLVAPREHPEEFRNWAESSLKDRQDVIFIGVDGGLDVILESGLPAGVAIGDWDSLKSKKALKETSHVSLTREKERSDLFHALEFASALGATDVIAYGFQGARMDHELGVFYDLREALPMFDAIVWVGARSEAWMMESGTFEIEFKKGESFSLYALSDQSTGVTVENARYELKNARLGRSTLGLSNKAKGSVGFRVKSGGVMVMTSEE